MSLVGHIFPKMPQKEFFYLALKDLWLSARAAGETGHWSALWSEKLLLFFSSNCIPDVLLHLERATPNVAQGNWISKSQGPSKHKVISGWNNPPALEVAFGVAWKGTRGNPCQLYAGTQISGHLTTLPMPGLAGDPSEGGTVAPAEGPAGRVGLTHKLHISVGFGQCYSNSSHPSPGW